MSSTRAAFGLPARSPTTGDHTPPPAAYTQGSVNGIDSDMEQSSSSYTYPPAPRGPGSYDYVPQTSYEARPALSSPTSSTFFARNQQGTANILPLHRGLHPLSPSSPHLASTWARIRAWLSNEYPELDDTLNYGILPVTLSEIEAQLGLQLPAAVQDSYLAVDGQEAESSAGCSEGLFFGLTLLPLEDVLEEWRFWRDVDDDPATGANPQLQQIMDSIPPGWVRKEYSQRGWIPLITDKAGNYLGVDMSPGEAGKAGQVIIFGRDFDTKVAMFHGDGPAGWAKWLAGFAEELESGEGFELGVSGDASDGSEDSVGYEGYFYGGSSSSKGEGGGTGEASGLRLTGDYRGWSVLEAWADRSVRRWREAGLLPEAPPKVDEIVQPSENGASESTFTALPARPSGSATNSSADLKPTTLRPENLKDNSKHTHRVRVSLSKAPAPAPLPLPTADDIIPSPTSSYEGTSRGFRLARLSDEESRLDTRPHPQETVPPPRWPLSPIVGPPSKEVSLEATLIAVPEAQPLPTAPPPLFHSPPLLSEEPNDVGFRPTPQTRAESDASRVVSPDFNATPQPASILSTAASAAKDMQMIAADLSNSVPGAGVGARATGSADAEFPDPTMATTRLIGGGGVARAVSEEEAAAPDGLTDGLPAELEIAEPAAKTESSEPAMPKRLLGALNSKRKDNL